MPARSSSGRRGPLLLLLSWVFPSLIGADTWEQPRTPNLEPIPGVASLSAASCGGCHAEIYREWKASVHARAWTDRQFQQERAKDPEIAWICGNCHTPVGNQQAEVVLGTGSPRTRQRRPNPDFDASLRDEGIACLTCHWRPDGMAAPHADVLAPHPVVYDPELRSSASCTTCHQATVRIEDALVCHFNTGAEWEEAAPGKTCVECHMERIDRAVAAGGPVRDGGRHLWPGGGVPKEAQTAAEEALFASWSTALDARIDAQPSAHAGSQVVVAARVTNARAGHVVPTGDPERHFLVRLEARKADGSLLASVEQRVGQEWEWTPVARQIADHRIGRGASVEPRALFTMPSEPVAVRLTVEHVRITDEAADFHHLGDYPRRRVVREATMRIELAR